MTTRIDRRFAALKPRTVRRSSPSSWPAIPTSRPRSRFSTALPGAGADIIELGMPFSDPMADGPAIQSAGQRALAGGQTLQQDARHGRGLPQKDDDHARSC